MQPFSDLDPQGEKDEDKETYLDMSLASELETCASVMVE